jgi:hypothetical protein
MRLTVRICSLALVTAALNHTAHGAEPSLKETTSWLEEKVKGLYAAQVLVQRCRHSTSYHTIAHNIWFVSINRGVLRITCDMSVSQVGGDEPSNFSSTQRSAVQLDQLYATCSVKQVAADVPPNGYLCSYELKQVPYEIRINGRNNNSVSIWIQDEDLAQRICKAFERLIELSGSKKEPF